MEEENKILKHFNEWKDIPLEKVWSMEYSKDPQKRVWYQEWRLFHTHIINPMSNYLKSKLDKELENISESDLTSAGLIKIIHNLLPNNLTIDDKVKIIEENQVRKHK